MASQPPIAEDSDRLSLSLEEAVAMALARNRALISSKNSLESSQLSIDSAESVFDIKFRPVTTASISDGDPGISAGIQVSKSLASGSYVSLTPDLGRNDSDYTGSVDLSLTVPLFRGRGADYNRASVHSSEYSFRTSQRNLYLSEVSTVTSTVSGVYDILRLKELETLYQGQISTMAYYAEASKIKENAGLATPMDVYRARIRLKDMEDSLSATRQDLLNAEENLKRLLSVSSETSLNVDAPNEIDPVDVSLKEAIRLALANRVEILQAMDELGETKRQAALAEHNLLPQLDLQLGYRQYGSDGHARGFFDFEENQWTISLVSSTDFARTSEKLAYQQSLIRIRNAELAMASLKDTIVAEVKQAMQALEKNAERIAIRRDQTLQARGKLALSKIKYKHGMMDNFDVIEAESEIQQAQTNLLSVQTDYIVGLYQLRAVMGTLIERSF